MHFFGWVLGWRFTHTQNEWFGGGLITLKGLNQPFQSDLEVAEPPYTLKSSLTTTKPPSLGRTCNTLVSYW